MPSISASLTNAPFFFIADFASTLTVKMCRMDYSAMLLPRDMLLNARNMLRKEQLPAVVKIVTISKREKNLYNSFLWHIIKLKVGRCTVMDDAQFIQMGTSQKIPIQSTHRS